MGRGWIKVGKRYEWRMNVKKLGVLNLRYSIVLKNVPIEYDVNKVNSAARAVLVSDIKVTISLERVSNLQVKPETRQV